MRNKSGDMYEWIDETWNPLAGRCPHECPYCYVKEMSRFPAIKAKYNGGLRLDEKVLNKNLGKGKTIFVCSMNDLFAVDVPNGFIDEVLSVPNCYSDNTYVFQTKNTKRYLSWLSHFPSGSVLGTTVETNRWVASKAAQPFERLDWMSGIPSRFKTFVTLEPIMDFDLEILSRDIIKLKPSFVNIGADSKRCNLVEPNKTNVLLLIDALRQNHIEVKIKDNLKRITG